MKYGPIFDATLRAGADFPDFVVARRQQTPGMRHSLLLELEKVGSRRHRPRSVNRPWWSIAVPIDCGAGFTEQESEWAAICFPTATVEAP
jgi:hypothetical protein